MIGPKSALITPNQKSARIEKRKRRRPEANGGDRLDQNFGGFQRADHTRLVIGIGDLATKRGENDRGQHEDADRQRDQCARLLAPPSRKEQEQHREDVADEIVVEGREKLAPEEWREAACPQKFEKHHRRLARVGTLSIGAKDSSGRPVERERSAAPLDCGVTERLRMADDAGDFWKFTDPARARSHRPQDARSRRSARDWRGSGN